MCLHTELGPEFLKLLMLGDFSRDDAKEFLVVQLKNDGVPSFPLTEDQWSQVFEVRYSVLLSQCAIMSVPEAITSVQYHWLALPRTEKHNGRQKEDLPSQYNSFQRTQGGQRSTVASLRINKRGRDGRCIRTRF